MDQAVDPLPQREGGARQERPQGGEERPEVGLAPIAERVLVIGCSVAAKLSDQEEQVVGEVGKRMGGLGGHGRRTGDDRGKELRDRHPKASRERNDDRP